MRGLYIFFMIWIILFKSFFIYLSPIAYTYTYNWMFFNQLQTRLHQINTSILLGIAI